MRKCQKYPLKFVAKSAMLASILKNQLCFVSAIVHISRIGSAVRQCACNPLSQNTTAHITTVALDDVICLGRRSHRASFAFGSYLSQLLSANSAQYKYVGVAQWQEHSPLTNATRVRFLAWEVRELGLRSLSDVGGFLRVLRFPPPTKTANYAKI